MLEWADLPDDEIVCLRFLLATGPTTVGLVATAVGLDCDRANEALSRLIERGLVTGHGQVAGYDFTYTARLSSPLPRPARSIAGDLLSSGLFDDL
ncbi:MAG: hypothetical protein WCJ67_08245 [Thermoleophilia bacterium]